MSFVVTYDILLINKKKNKKSNNKKFFFDKILKNQIILI